MSDNLARVFRPNGQDSWAQALPAARSHIEAVAPRAERRARPRIVYALTAGAGMAAIVITQLLLSVGISQGAYEISTLQASQVELGRTAESLSEDLVKVSSPQNLAANAAALGMVSNSTPAYLRLSDGAVLGAPVSATGTPADVRSGASGLVPNALLAGVPLVTDLPPAGAQGTGIGPAGTHGRSADARAAHAPAPAAPATPPSGLPSPSTR
ncbi:hypothetical protein SAMN05216282_102215 [Cryobacterium psychrotolerans]|uniref:Cell division protein FtsL n=1 Tax=Cryobacterium psychrotolerans TaxID=386301 RepID=A0A1G8YPJ7_9MICO|nr:MULTISPECIES: hypothetical protein [Cryobacterium]TFD47646.1 hypothetical protein E3T33_02295 [Cryobacterium sp. TMT1-2-1]TFD90977.1 hypothetical protein E3T56_00840 [Cryobacterium psychrotolerans]SDK04025.1 hypothetical protein SAMN05216282_102215 [Cryobacterium psychrotolerans]